MRFVIQGVSLRQRIRYIRRIARCIAGIWNDCGILTKGKTLQGSTYILGWIATRLRLLGNRLIGEREITERAREARSYRCFATYSLRKTSTLTPSLQHYLPWAKPRILYSWFMEMCSCNQHYWNRDDSSPMQN